MTGEVRHEFELSNETLQSWRLHERVQINSSPKQGTFVFTTTFRAPRHLQHTFQGLALVRPRWHGNLTWALGRFGNHEGSEENNLKIYEGYMLLRQTELGSG